MQSKSNVNLLLDPTLWLSLHGEMISAVRNRCTQTHRTHIHFAGVHYRTHHVGNSKGNRLPGSAAVGGYFARMQSCGTPSISHKFLIVSFLASSAHRSHTRTLKTAVSLSFSPSPSLLFLSLTCASVPRMVDVVAAALRSVQPAGPLKSSSALFSPCLVALRGGAQIVNDSPPLFLLPVSSSSSCLFFF